MGKTRSAPASLRTDRLQENTFWHVWASVMFLLVLMGKKLPVAVMEKDDIPLFVLPWMVSFGMKLPLEVSIKSNNLSREDVNITEEEIKALLKEYDRIFSDGLGKTEGVKAFTFILM
jgi:hypothetical protein